MRISIPEFDTINTIAQNNVWRRFRKHPGAMAGTVMMLLIGIAILFSPLLPYNPEASDVSIPYQAPTWQHLMGTDALGRDMLTRILYGGRISLSVGLTAVAVTLLIGITIGALAGYFGGWVDTVLMRLTDAALTLPVYLVLILLSAILRETAADLFQQSSVITIALVIGLLSWMTSARLTRAIFMTLREMTYIQAARGLGASDLRIILTHILPNGLGPVIVDATLELGYAIIEESGLSFLGFGIQPPVPSWGNLLSDAQEHFTTHPWLAVFPGLMIFITIISVNYIGDGLRDALDPHKVLEKVGEF